MANIWTVNSGGGADFTTIQAAINAASSGDTIMVAAGLYPEQITINKSLTLLGAQAGVNPITSTRLGGESVIDSAFPVSIAANDITLNGFEIKDFYNGIFIPLSSFIAPDYIIQNIDLEYNYIHSSVANVGFAAEPGKLINLKISHNIFFVDNVSPQYALAAIGFSSGATVNPIYETVEISSNKIENISSAGAFGVFAGADPDKYTITDCMINCNQFINIPDGSNFNLGNITNGQFINNLVEIVGGTIGIQTGVIYGNTFQTGASLGLWGTEFGFLLPSKDVFISYNTFTDEVTGRGIRLREGVLSDTIVISLNDFNDSGIPPVIPPDSPIFTGYLISNNGIGTVSAINNWWGSAAGPGGNTGGIYGLVTTTPWLTSYVLTPSRQTAPTCWPLSTFMTVNPGFWIYPAVNQLLHNTTVNGAIATAGNTLGLWGQFAPPNPSGGIAADGIGAFITTNTSLTFDGYPAGTTNDWQLNSSANMLTLPTDSTIEKAYLFYSATQKNSDQDVSAFINEPIVFTPPSAVPVDLLPDLIISVVAPSTGNIIYHASKDITVFMEGSGSYTIGSVPAVLGVSTFTGMENNFAGWTIVVLYRNPALPLRNLAVWNEFEMLFTGNDVTIPISGFATSPFGTPSGKLWIAAGNGDNYVAGDQTEFGPDVNNLVSLSGPNNGLLNFYQSQINDDNGLLSTSGSFGTANQPFGGSLAAPTAPAARQGWDKTAIDISSTLTTNQTNAAILLTDPELYFPQYAALQIDLSAPIIVPAKTVNRTAAKVGDTLTYTVIFTNTGSLNADNITITDTLPAGTVYVPGSVSANVPITGDPSTVIQLTNSLAPGETAIISFAAGINALPLPNPIVNTAVIGYDFIPAIGASPISVTADTNSVSTLVFEPSRGVLFI